VRPSQLIIGALCTLSVWLLINVTLFTYARAVDVCERRCLEEDNLVVVEGGAVISINLADGLRGQLLYMKVVRVKAIPIQAPGEALRAPGY